MRIGFDLDGVLAESDIPMYRIADQFNKEISNEIYQWACRTAKPLLNPEEFMLEPEDEYIIITARNNSVKDITKRWVNKYCKGCKQLIMLNHDLPNQLLGIEVIEWLNEIAEAKAKSIKENNIDIFFDDSSYICKRLRKLCPDVKIINFGGRI